MLSVDYFAYFNISFNHLWRQNKLHSFSKLAHQTFQQIFPQSYKITTDLHVN